MFGFHSAYKSSQNPVWMISVSKMTILPSEAMFEGRCLDAWRNSLTGMEAGGVKI